MDDLGHLGIPLFHETSIYVSFCIMKLGIILYMYVSLRMYIYRDIDISYRYKYIVSPCITKYFRISYDQDPLAQFRNFGLANAEGSSSGTGRPLRRLAS